MKFKMNITNYKDFEKVLKECKDPVYTINANGTKVQITPAILLNLKEQFMQCKRNITIWCECNTSSDYYRLLTGTVWQC